MGLRSPGRKAERATLTGKFHSSHKSSLATLPQTLPDDVEAFMARLNRKARRHFMSDAKRQHRQSTRDLARLKSEYEAKTKEAAAEGST